MSMLLLLLRVVAMDGRALLVSRMECWVKGEVGLRLERARLSMPEWMLLMNCLRPRVQERMMEREAWVWVVMMYGMMWNAGSEVELGRGT